MLWTFHRRTGCTWSEISHVCLERFKRLAATFDIQTSQAIQTRVLSQLVINPVDNSQPPCVYSSV
jgi:hypothetical protein